MALHVTPGTLVKGTNGTAVAGEIIIQGVGEISTSQSGQVITIASAGSSGGDIQALVRIGVNSVLTDNITLRGDVTTPYISMSQGLTQGLNLDGTFLGTEGVSFQAPTQYLRFQPGNGVTLKGALLIDYNSELEVVDSILEDLNANKADKSEVTALDSTLRAVITAGDNALSSSINTVSTSLNTTNTNLQTLSTNVQTIESDIVDIEDTVEELLSYYQYNNTDKSLIIGRNDSPAQILINYDGAATPQVIITDGQNSTVTVKSNQAIISNAVINEALEVAQHSIKNLTIGGLTYTVFLPRG
jgi:hypothetical protein